MYYYILFLRLGRYPDSALLQGKVVREFEALNNGEQDAAAADTAFIAKIEVGRGQRGVGTRRDSFDGFSATGWFLSFSMFSSSFSLGASFDTGCFCEDFDEIAY